MGGCFPARRPKDEAPIPHVCQRRVFFFISYTQRMDVCHTFTVRRAHESTSTLQKPNHISIRFSFQPRSTQHWSWPQIRENDSSVVDLRMTLRCCFATPGGGHIYQLVFSFKNTFYFLFIFFTERILQKILFPTFLFISLTGHTSQKIFFSLKI